MKKFGRRQVLSYAAIAALSSIAMAAKLRAESNQNVTSIGIEDLRQQAKAAFQARNQELLASILAQLIAAGEGAIRRARANDDLDARRALVTSLQQDADLVYAVAATYATNPKFANLAFMTAVARKGRVQKEELIAQMYFGRSLLASNAALRDQLQLAEQQLTSSAIKLSFDIDVPPRTIDQQIAAVTAARSQIRNSNVFVGMAQAGFAVDDISLDMGISAFTISLILGRVAVIYVRYDNAAIDNLSTGAQYMALVVKSGVTPTVVPLGSADVIAAAVKEFVSAVSDPASVPDGTSNHLNQLIIAPLLVYLDGGPIRTGELSICPDGELFLLPFDALKSDSGYLCDAYDLRYIDSPAELAITAGGSMHNALSDFVGFANPQFGTAKLPSLPETHVELATVSALWPTNKRTVVEASQATPSHFLKLASGAGFLHVATHGKLVVDPANSLGNARSHSLDESQGTSLASTMESTLARSILFLAPDGAAAGPGFISALDIGSLDLSHTQLVVLSACETGLGDFENGEGVYGFREAFRLAGAGTIVSSLWEVNSDATTELMVAFYRSLFQVNSAAQALDLAKRLVRKSHQHPYFWASFITTGLDAISIAKVNN